MSDDVGSPSNQAPDIERHLLKRIVPYTGIILIIVACIIGFGIYKYINGRAPHYVTNAEIVGSVVAIIASVACVVIGTRIMLRDESVPSYVIRPEDRLLLEELIRAGDERAIDQYVRLSSLSGTTGTATKLGLTGLPLATVGLTIFFSILAILDAKNFLDLAKLTLGAFIGSFVQRNISNEKTGAQVAKSSN